MHNATLEPPALFASSLSRRVVERYFMLGLAAILVCVVSAVVLAWLGSFIQMAAVAAAGPILVLLCGAPLLKRVLSPIAEIDGQLRQVAAAGSLETLPSPVIASAEAVRGWNIIVRRLHDLRTSASLEDKLRASLGSVDQRRWTAVVNALSDGVCVTDSSLTVLQANNAFAALLNVATPEEIAGRKVIELLEAVTSPESAAEAKAIREGAGSAMSELFRGREPAEGVLRVTRSPFSCDTFGAGALLWTIRDVTQHKLADAMRNQFVSTTTHELRTPLTNIVAYAELLADETEVDLVKQKEFCNLIRSEASRLSRFIDQMLNVSRMEAGAITLERHETDVARMIDEIVAAVQPQAHQKNQTFSCRLSPKIPKLRIDKDKIASTLVNLLGNAVKYTPERGVVSLTVETTGDSIAFYVDDNGFGISAADLPRIGSKFFRSADARVREITGSGLGLAFGQEVARLHGGGITISSELNKGSRFTLTLPCVKTG